VSPRCWRWRFSGRFFGGDRVNQHPPVLGRRSPALCAWLQAARRRALGLHRREMGSVRTVVLGDNLETGDLDRSGLFSVPLRRHRLRLGDLWGRSARTYLLRQPLAGLRKNRRSSSITLPALAADGPFPHGGADRRDCECPVNVDPRH
jgi:hypothetical protein